MSLEMSDNSTRNSSGPSTVPCGTPEYRAVTVHPSRDTHKMISVKQKAQKPISELSGDA